MKYITINSNAKYLEQKTFVENSAVYVVNGDYIVNSQITLPSCCELRIEEGSITLESSNETSLDLQAGSYKPNGFYLLCSDQKDIKAEYDENQNNKAILNYPVLCLTSKAIKVENEDLSDNNSPIKVKGTMRYEQTSSVFMKSGDYIKNIEPDNFEMRLTADCRILLPEGTNKANLYIFSDKVNTIQIDGKCNFQLFAENCKFERIFACEHGMVLTNRVDVINDISDNNDSTNMYLSGDNCYSLFKDCEIFAEDFDSNLIPPDTSFLSIWTNVGIRKVSKPESDTYAIVHPKIKALEVINRLIMHNCIIKNIGISGTVSVDNCLFLFGPNVNNNYETIHCSNHSRITNCVLDGRENIKGVPKLNADVIDTFNGHDIIIEGCTFKSFSGPNGSREACNLITVKSHYYSGDPDIEKQDQMSNFIGPQNVVIIRNCFFDLPIFAGSALEVWNGPADLPKQDRAINRQFTIIEGNYIEMPKAEAFVNCLMFSDYVIVRNNIGCVNKQLVIVNERFKDPTNSDLEYNDKPINKAHNLIIEGNNLRYHKYKKTEVPNGMLIFTGTCIDNLVLANNTVEGSLWSMWQTDKRFNLSGTVRVINNESIGDVLFRSRNDVNAIMPDDVITFFSGNVSNGKKTDIGDYNMRESMGDGLFFNGRLFFSIETDREYIDVDDIWHSAYYKME